MRLLEPVDKEQNRLFATWAGQQLDVTFAEPFAALAIVDARNVIIGAVVLNNYDGNNIDLSGCGEGAFTPSVVRSISHRIFDELNCARVTLKTRRSNKSARKLLGRHFKYEARLRHGFRNEDAYQFRMCRDECPWLRKH